MQKTFEVPSIAKQWALVTGSSRGIGQQVARALASLKCNVVLHARTLAHTESLAQELKGMGVAIAQVQGDLSDQSQVDGMLQKVAELTPHIDILYNNAAIMPPWRNDPWSFTAEDFRSGFEVNVISLVRICQAIVPGMITRGYGRVVNVTSGVRNEPQLTAYALSKAAIDKYVADWIPGLKGTGVSMTLLDPGWLRTDLGGPNAPNSVESVLPGAIVPALADTSHCGTLFRAQDYAGMQLADALQRIN